MSIAVMCASSIFLWVLISLRSQLLDLDSNPQIRHFSQIYRTGGNILRTILILCCPSAEHMVLNGIFALSCNMFCFW